MGGYPSASYESSSYHTDDNHRNAHQHNYGGNYGQSQQSLQEQAQLRRESEVALAQRTTGARNSSTYLNEASAHLYDWERPASDHIRRHNDPYLT